MYYYKNIFKIKQNLHCDLSPRLHLLRVHLDSEFIVAVLALQQIQVVRRRRNQILWLVVSWIVNFLLLSSSLTQSKFIIGARPPWLCFARPRPWLPSWSPPLCPSWPCLAIYEVLLKILSHLLVLSGGNQFYRWVKKYLEIDLDCLFFIFISRNWLQALIYDCSWLDRRQMTKDKRGGTGQKRRNMTEDKKHDRWQDRRQW